MAWDAHRFAEELGRAVDVFDRAEAERLCRSLIEKVRGIGEPFDLGAARMVLGHLRRKRYFDLMLSVADTFIQTGLNQPTVRRQYVQALIDQGKLSAALPFLEALVADTGLPGGDVFEHGEARGLLGRAHKQIYIDIANAACPEARRSLNRAIRAYSSAYLADRAANRWHGINTAALLRRAATDGVDVEGIRRPAERSTELAREILEAVRRKWENGNASMWDSGTAMEACLGLDLGEEAMVWLNRYVSEPRSDAFELGSTLRQLEEVWGLDIDREPGSRLLPVLRAELLRREGGGFDAAPEKLKTGRLATVDPQLEKVLGKSSYVSYRFMLRAVERARAVARIEHEPDQGFGTGFVVRGGSLHESLGDELVVLTNAHVVCSDERVSDALRPDQASVTFQLLREERGAEQEHDVKEVLWSSPPWELDTSVLRLEGMPDGLEPYPVAPRLPLADGEQRVYVIGHPRGGSLSFSIQDNLLLDHKDPKLHYRAPTEGGSSGSPVFNSQWKLIGIHHAGSKEMRKLNDRKGTYEANEGLWIQSVRAAMAEKPPL